MRIENRNYAPVQGWARCALSDMEIITLVLGGNDAAFEGIMRRCNRLLFRLARAIVRNDPDLVTPKLAALQFYQLAIPTPTPPKGSFD